MPLSLDELENLQDLLSHEAYPLLLKELDRQAQVMESEMVRLRLGPENERHFLLLKARSEGARLFASNFTSHLADLRKK